MSHYYDKIPTCKSKEIKRMFIINQKSYNFITDSGVFSKKGLDFGTRTLLETLDLNNIQGSVLDFGCGYGPIGIYISKNTDAVVDMIDINKRSVFLTCKNIELNNVKANVFISDMYSNIIKKYDFIITNPPIRIGKQKLYKILLEARNYLKENGQLWLVIHKNQGAKSIIKVLSTKYKVQVVRKNKGFYVLCGKVLTN